jgi:hypothetical protein
VDLEESVLDSPYANTLIRQFVLTSLTKLYARPAVSNEQRQRIQTILDGFSTSPELEIQQRAVEFESLFGQREFVSGVLEQMPPPEIKATVIGTGDAFNLNFNTTKLTTRTLSERESDSWIHKRRTKCQRCLLLFILWIILPYRSL